MRAHCAGPGPDHCVWCGELVPVGWRRMRLRCPITYRERLRRIVKEMSA